MSELGGCGQETIDELLTRAYLDHAASIRGAAVRTTRDPELASDVTQEAFLRLVSEAQAGRCPDNIGGWLFRTSTNLIVSRARRDAVARRNAPALRNFDGPAQPESIAAIREERRDLETALATLRSDDRTALLMAAHGVPGRDIGRRLGRSPAATRTLLSRARGRLRDAAVQPTGPTIVGKSNVETQQTAAKPWTALQGTAMLTASVRPCL